MGGTVWVWQGFSLLQAKGGGIYFCQRNLI